MSTTSPPSSRSFTPNAAIALRNLAVGLAVLIIAVVADGMPRGLRVALLVVMPAFLVHIMVTATRRIVVSPSQIDVYLVGRCRSYDLRRTRVEFQEVLGGFGRKNNMVMFLRSGGRNRGVPLISFPAETIASLRQAVSAAATQSKR